MNNSALIGYTGFIGSNLAEQYEFTDLYNSKNINDIIGKEYDIIFSCANSGYKYKVQENPDEDLQNILNYIEILEQVKFKKIVLISSIDVYPHPFGVNEENIVAENPLLKYGANRLLMEMVTRISGADYLIIRVPIIYGKYFKKNIIYDLIYKNNIDKINFDAILQIYNVKNLKKHIDIALDSNLKTLNLATQPLSAREIGFILDNDSLAYSHSFPFRYDMHTKHADLFGKEGNYLQSKQEIIDELIRFKFQILNGDS